MTTSVILSSCTRSQIIKVDVVFTTLFCFLLALVLADKAFVDDTRCQAQLELVLLNAFIKKLYESNLGSFLLLSTCTVIPSLYFCIFDPQSELLCHLVKLHIIRRHRLGYFVNLNDNLSALSYEGINKLFKNGEQG